MSEIAKQYLVRLARQTGLLPAAEKLRGGILGLKNRRADRRFRSEHPDVELPPIRLMHDPLGTVKYAVYWESGKKAAEALSKIIDENCGEPGKGVRVLEWGCGPGRVIRHLSGLGKAGPYELYGCDYNQATIAWCRTHLPGITFASNALAPPLNYSSGFFDFIYCISVFTHLSEPMHHAWLAELMRILKPGGCLLLSLHGDYYRRKLLPDELARYDAGDLVVREGVSEGGRMYTAFHGERFVREHFLASAEILQRSTKNPLSSPQDLWLVRKPTGP